MFLRSKLLLALLMLLVSACSTDEATSTDTENVVQLDCRDMSTLDNFKNGDIIIRRGSGMISDKIMENLDEEIPLSHMGLIAEHKGQMMVAQSATRDDSIYTNDLHYATIQRFVEGAQDCFCYSVRYQPNGAYEPEVGAKIAEEADKMIKKGALFDFGFDMSEQKHIHCTEFIWLAYTRALNEDFFPRTTFIRGKETIPLNFFLTDERYKTIYTPEDFGR